MVPRRTKAAVVTAPEVGASPDPILSANVYCAGRLCEVIRKVVGPFWQGARELAPEGTASVWLMRYSRGGEHLKVRVNAEPALASQLRQRLSVAAAEYFSGIAAEPPSPPPRPSTATPIDLEDSSTEIHSDRSLLWTGYRRSHVCFGYEPYPSDDTYVALFVACLARGTDILLQRLEVSADGTSRHSTRQTLLLHAVGLAVGRLALSPRRRSEYLLYHRDTLLRALRGRQPGAEGAKKVQELVVRFEGLADALGAERQRLALALAGSGDTGDGTDRQLTPSDDLRSWIEAVEGLAGYVRTICGDEAHHIDPFAPDPMFPPLFKVLHGFANQVGIDALNEAFAHHLLLSVLGEPDLHRSTVRLVPSL